MKILKKVIIALIVLVGIYVLLAIIGPSSYKVERSKRMSASKAALWSQVSQFENWPNWSPWQEKDPSVKNQFETKEGIVGSSMSWVGNEELSGTGSMVVTNVDAGNSINYDLKFVVPFEMQSKGGFVFADKSEGVELSWYDEGDIPFMMRPMMLFMNLEDQIGPDFERGLEKLDSVAMTLIQKSDFDIREVEFSSQNYIGINNEISIEEASNSEFYGVNFAKLGQVMAEKQLEMAGMPVCIVYKWDEENGVAHLAPAFPVMVDDVELPDGFEMIQLNNQKAVLGKHYGAYEDSGEMHGAIEEYLSEKGLHAGLVVEEYANDPAEVAPEEVLTNIYYLLEE